MDQKVQKKSKLVLPYREIRIRERVVGRLYLMGTARWERGKDQVTALLSFSKDEKDSELFLHFIKKEKFFSMSDGMISDPSGKNLMMVGTLRCLLHEGGDTMGFIKCIAMQMEESLAKNVFELESERGETVMQ